MKGQGALQSRGTCWLYTVINQLMLSWNMFKILFSHMTREYDKMTEAEKAFFDSSIEAPCPLGKNFKKIYFYKFLDQFCNLTTAPPELTRKAQKSINLLNLWSPLKSYNRAPPPAPRPNKPNAPAVAGLWGGHTTPEYIKAIRTLGITEFSHAGITGFPKEFAKKAREVFTDTSVEFFVCHYSKTNLNHVYPAFDSAVELQKAWLTEYPVKILLDKTIFDLSSAAINIRNSQSGALHASHSIVAFRDKDGQGYLYDSNNKSTSRPGKWWDPYELDKMVREYVAPLYEQFKNGRITNIAYQNFTYVNRAIAEKIVPKARVLSRNINFNTSNYLEKYPSSKVGLLISLSSKVNAGTLTEAQKIKIIKNFNLVKNLNTSKYLNRNSLNNLTASLNRKPTLTKLERAKIIRNYKNYKTFSPTKLLNTPNNLLNIQVRAGLLTKAQKQKIINARKARPIITFEEVLAAGIHKNSIKNWEESSYRLTESTKKKIRNYLAKPPPEVINLTGSPSPRRQNVVNLTRSSSTPRQPPRRQTSTPRRQSSTPRRQTSTPRRQSSTPRQPPRLSRSVTPIRMRSLPTSPIPFSLNKARGEVNKLKTITERRKYLRLRANDMETNNWIALGNYIKVKNRAQRIATNTNREARAPISPGAGLNVNKILHALGTFKTMKNRQAYAVKKKADLRANGIATPANLKKITNRVKELDNLQRQSKQLKQRTNN